MYQINHVNFLPREISRWMVNVGNVVEEKKRKAKKIKTTSEKDWQHGAVGKGGDGEIGGRE